MVKGELVKFNFPSLFLPRDEQVLLSLPTELLPFSSTQSRVFAKEQLPQPVHICFWRQITSCEVARKFWHLALEYFLSPKKRRVGGEASRTSLPYVLQCFTPQGIYASSSKAAETIWQDPCDYTCHFKVPPKAKPDQQLLLWSSAPLGSQSRAMGSIARMLPSISSSTAPCTKGFMHKRHLCTSGFTHGKVQLKTTQPCTNK